MNSTFYRVCVDRFVNKDFIITDCLENLLPNINKARCKMIKLVDDAISIKSLKLDFEENNDNSISIFSTDKNGNKSYNVVYYVTKVEKYDNGYRYRGYDIFKNQDIWFIRSDKSGVISYKSELGEALLYIDYIIAAMKNMEFLDKYYSNHN